MSEQELSRVTNTKSTEKDSPQDDHLLAKLILEIQQIPEEYLPNLLQIVRLFRESVTMKPVRSQASVKAMDEIKNPDPVKKSVRQIALSELLRQWREEGDEQEQTETAEILRKALGEDPSVRFVRERVTPKPIPSDDSPQNPTPETLEANRLAQQHKALKELTRLWIEEGDEQEQTETWEYLRQVLDQDRLSNRPLFS